MGRFLNPDYSAFKDVLDSKIYVDKTELLEYTNSVINPNLSVIAVHEDSGNLLQQT